jgi:gas vesicle protein
MNRSDTDSYAQASDWVMGTARRNPEALLLLAAGCALLMRSGRGSSRRAATPARYPDRDYSPVSRGYSPASETSSVSQGLSRTAEKATDYASDIKDRVTDTASAYAESVSDFAADARRTVSEGSERFKRQAETTLNATMDRVLRDQPLAVALAGLAAGAAVAAAFPSTDVENRALGGAHEALANVVDQAGKAVMGAASKAGDHLKTAAEERGLTSQGLKDLASDVAGTFTDAVAGKTDDPKTDDHRGATMVPESPASPAGASPATGAMKTNIARDAVQAPASKVPEKAGPSGGSIR